jgi:hypothetical protein
MFGSVYGEAKEVVMSVPSKASHQTHLQDQVSEPSIDLFRSPDRFPEENTYRIASFVVITTIDYFSKDDSIRRPIR